MLESVCWASYKPYGARLRVRIRSGSALPSKSGGEGAYLVNPSWRPARRSPPVSPSWGPARRSPPSPPGGSLPGARNPDSAGRERKGGCTGGATRKKNCKERWSERKGLGSWGRILMEEELSLLPPFRQLFKRQSTILLILISFLPEVSATL